MEEEILNKPEGPVEVVDIQFRPGQKVYYFDPNGARYSPGDHVIIDTARGAEYGICTGGNHEIAPKDVVAPQRPVLRLALPRMKGPLPKTGPRKRRPMKSVCKRLQTISWICSW